MTISCGRFAVKNYVNHYCEWGLDVDSSHMPRIKFISSSGEEVAIWNGLGKLADDPDVIRSQWHSTILSLLRMEGISEHLSPYRLTRQAEERSSTKLVIPFERAQFEHVLSKARPEVSSMRMPLIRGRPSLSR
jgi:hypothetical protein